MVFLLVNILTIVFACAKGHSTLCREGFYQCPNTEICIEADKLLDGKVDCLGASDEIACKPTEFQCQASRKCVPKQKMCNKELDCPQGEDEDPQNCYQHKCAETEWLCAYLLNKCVKPCSGLVAQCSDFSDITEKACQVARSVTFRERCLDSEFACASNPTECMPRDKLCDDKFDCPDKSDELNCAQKKPVILEGMFTCLTNKQVIPESWVCNKVPECIDKSDESLAAGCRYLLDNNALSGLFFSACRPNQFSCVVNDEHKCIPSERVCDGIADCDLHEDELNTEGKNCKSSCEAENKFPCRTAKGVEKCIDRSLVCDGIKHCPNGDDESYSPRTNCSRRSCQVNNGGCNQLCEQVDLFSPVSCACNPGFLNKDGRDRCVPMGEATLSFVNQGHIYERRLGQVKLSMLDFDEPNTHQNHRTYATHAHWVSKTWKKDEQSRVRTGQHDEDMSINPQTSVFWQNITAIDYAFQLYSSSESVVTISQLERSKSIDTGRIIIWAQSNRLFPGLFLLKRTATSSSKTLDTEIEPLAVDNELFAIDSEICSLAYQALNSTLKTVASGPLYPMDVAFDWVHGLLYWTNPYNRTVSVLDIRTGWRKTILVNVTAEKLAVDPRLANLYYVDQDRVQVCSSSGATCKTCLSMEPGELVGDLALDSLNNELYWTEVNSGRVGAMSLITNEKRYVVASTPVPKSLEIFADHLYWFDQRLSAIVRVNKQQRLNESQVEIVQEIEAGEVTSLRIQHDVSRPAWLNRCSSNPCSQICLPTHLLNYPPTDPPYECACADGWELDLNDRETCRHSDEILRQAVAEVGAELPTLYAKLGGMKSFTDEFFDSSRVDPAQYWRLRALRAQLSSEEDGDPWLTAIFVLFLMTATALITTVMACGLHHGSKKHISSTLNLVEYFDMMEANNPSYVHLIPSRPVPGTDDDDDDGGSGLKIKPTKNDNASCYESASSTPFLMAKNHNQTLPN